MSEQYKPLRSTRPPTSILSPAFKYRSAAATDLRETFARVRAAMNLPQLKARVKA